MNHFFLCLFTVTLLMSSQCAYSVDPEFFYLVLTWPPSFWNKEGKRCFPKFGKPAVNFMIHGLWAELKNGSHLTNCANTPFEKSKVSSMINSLEKNWPPLNCPGGDDGTSMWSHQWLKHGTCSKPLITNQFSYFETTLKLREKLIEKGDIIAALQKEGVKPNGQGYPMAKIIDAIQKGVGFIPRIKCYYKNTTSGRQLYEIYFCVEGSSLVDCKNLVPFVTGCGSFKILFPQF